MKGKKIDMTGFMKDSVMNEVIGGILDGAEKERHQLYDEIVNKDYEKDITKIDIGDFYLSYFYPFEEYLNVLLQNKLNLNEEQRFFVINADFFNRHFESLFQKYEGGSCCADKSNKIIRSIFEFLKTGDQIKFDYSQQYTYHLPRKILKSHDEIILAYQAIKSLIFGRGEKYFEFMSLLLQRESW
jgi:hypothetical protein